MITARWTPPRSNSKDDFLGPSGDTCVLLHAAGSVAGTFPTHHRVPNLSEHAFGPRQYHIPIRPSCAGPDHRADPGPAMQCP